MVETTVTSPREYYIITTRHKALIGAVLLFWAPNKSGYSYTLGNAGRYSEQEANKIADPDHGTYMVPCDSVDKVAWRVVDIDKFKELTGVFWIEGVKAGRK